MLNILDKQTPSNIRKKYDLWSFRDVIEYFEEKEIIFVYESILGAKKSKHLMKVFYKETLIYQTTICDTDKACLTMATKYVFDNLDTKILTMIIYKI